MPTIITHSFPHIGWPTALDQENTHTCMHTLTHPHKWKGEWYRERDGQRGEMTERLRTQEICGACAIWHVVKCEIHRSTGNGEVAILSLEFVGEASLLEIVFPITVPRQNSSFSKTLAFALKPSAYWRNCPHGGSSPLQNVFTAVLRLVFDWLGTIACPADT